MAVWLVLAVALVACGDDPEIANPASEFCVEQGGTVEIVTDAAGNQSGLCLLPDGTQADEWEYYRRYHEDEGAGLANPAAVFCEEAGGVVSGDEPMCELPDGSTVDAWDYFRTQSGSDG
jgi:putative hemolysin